jgi:hypothetical protein
MPRKALRLIRNIVFALLLIFACPAILIGGADISCGGLIDQWLPMYPGAEVVSVEYNFIRARASGRTMMTLSTPEEAETVRQFYRDNIIKLMEDQTPRGNASTSWEVEENTEGEGSLIHLFSVCGQF